MSFLITKPDMSKAWANGGSSVKPADAKIDLGWVDEKPPYQTENWIQKRNDEYLQHLDERGVPNWDALVIYQKGSLAFGTDEVWQSLQNSNLNHALIDDGGWWIRLRELLNPVGIIAPFAIPVPVGWLECNGAAVSRTAYARLFTKLGTTFGVGDGSTTFNVPNLKERLIKGAGNGGLATGSLSLSNTYGVASKPISVGNMPSHGHSASFSGSAMSGHGHSASFTGNLMSGHGHSASFTGTYVPNHTHQSPNSAYAGGSSASGGDIYSNKWVYGVNGITSGDGGHTPAGSVSIVGASAGTPSGSVSIVGASAGTPSGSVTVSNNGSGTYFDIQQPYMTLNMGIKY